MSPFYRVSAPHWAAMLEHRMDYHAKFGVDRYIFYVEGGYEALATIPNLQALTAAGKLRVVQWEELPHQGTATRRWPYAFQNMVYLHMMLATFHEDALAALMDIDEYLVTPKKTTLAEVLQTCADSVNASGVSIRLNRRVAWCSGCSALLSPFDSGGARVSRSIYDNLDREVLTRAAPLEQVMWVNPTFAKMILRVALSGSTSAELPPPSHPLALYGRHTMEWFPKSVVAVRHIATVNPHFAYPLPGLLASGGNDSCAYILHLTSQMTLRLPRPEQGFLDERAVPRNFFWVLDELAA
ncbi:hypothetical protein PLESTF_000729400 [Pleodorina starrii]|nr:hypothetical protein PLESTF_000729400 [Pleodorina starrii]